MSGCNDIVIRKFAFCGLTSLKIQKNFVFLVHSIQTDGTLLWSEIKKFGFYEIGDQPL